VDFEIERQRLREEVPAPYATQSSQDHFRQIVVVVVVTIINIISVIIFTTITTTTTIIFIVVVVIIIFISTRPWEQTYFLDW
jgi:hypothetical protein